jgi:perosamine synthetase
VEASTTPSCHYLPQESTQAGLLASGWVMRHADRAHLAERRRAHYRDWLARVSVLPRCRPLFTGLPEGVVPYMFPLLLEDCEADFYRLKQQGMPLWRWDEQALSGCEVAATYRKHLVHLPCHQGLSPAQMDWMGQLLALVLGG